MRCSTAIDAAQESIYLETYIWKGDAVGQEFKEHLARKAAAGRRRLRRLRPLRQPGRAPAPSRRFRRPIHTLAYQAIRRPWHLLDPRRYALEHRKLLVVDGHVGFLGGYNLGSLYATEWRDTHLRIEGPAAAHLAARFVDFWNSQAPAETRTSRATIRASSTPCSCRTITMRCGWPSRSATCISRPSTGRSSISG